MFCTKTARKLAGTLAAAGTAVATLATVAAVSLGAPAASAATHQAAPPEVTTPGAAAPAGLTWHNIKLVNGWKPLASSYDQGTPRWAVSNGVVYLTGSMTTSSTKQVFAVLPRAARPAKTMYIQVYTTNDVPGELQILADGIALMYSTTNSAEVSTSLAGASFPARAILRNSLNLLHGWTPGPKAWNAGLPAYSLLDGIAHLSGALSQPSGTNPIFARLPSSARPAHVLFIAIDTGNDSPGGLEILPNGEMIARSGDAQVFTSLDGLSYPVRSVRTHEIKLLHGWKSTLTLYTTGNPSYVVRGGVVYLSGGLHQPAIGGNGEIGVLPRGARPAHNLYITTVISTGAAGDLLIQPNGQMWLGSGSSYTAAETFTSLASISFPVKS